MKDLLILQDVKNISSKKSKGAKKFSGVDFASLLYSSKESKEPKNLLVLQSNLKAKNSILNQNINKIELSSALIEENKSDSSLLANLLTKPKNLQERVKKIVDNAKQMNEILPKRLQISDAEILQDIKDDMNNLEYGKELLDDLHFTQILDFIDVLKQDKKNINLGEFFKTKQNIKEIITSLNKTNNVHELVKIAKEYNLGLKNITYEKISNNEYNEQIFKQPYPKLYEQNFFAHQKINLNEKLENKQINLQSLLQEKTVKIKENNEKNIEKTLKTGALNDILKELPKEISKENKTKIDIKIDVEKTEKTTPKTQENNKKHSKNIDVKNEKLEVNKINEIKSSDVKISDIKQNDVKLNDQKQPEIKLNEIKNIVKEETKPQITEEQNTENQDIVKSTDGLIKEEKLSMPQALKADFFNPNKELSKEQTRIVIDNFTRDFKEEIEKFKAPNHKVSISLNPKELGEINVTMIARGNNLHINLNSANQNTLNLFIANQQEFKNSLVNMGFTGLAMNFGDKKEGSHQENQQKARKKYEEIEELDATSDMPAGINAVLYRYL